MLTLAMTATATINRRAVTARPTARPIFVALSKTKFTILRCIHFRTCVNEIYVSVRKILNGHCFSQRNIKLKPFISKIKTLYKGQTFNI